MISYLCNNFLKLIMFINTGRVFGTEYISYLLGRDKDTCIKNVIDKLSKSNIYKNFTRIIN
jgi:hypothetical protein